MTDHDTNNDTETLAKQGWGTVAESEFDLLWDLTQRHCWAGWVHSGERWSLCNCGVRVPWVGSDCGDPSDDSWMLHLRSVLTPHVVARDADVAAQAKAEALREAADQVRRSAWFHTTDVARWLDARADALRAAVAVPEPEQNGS